jgi:membrane protein required for colicin V production
MTGFDYGVLAVLGLSAAIGIWRGLLREVFALAAWIAATVAAILFAGEAAALLPADFATPLVRSVIAVAVLFVTVLMAVSLGGVLASRLARAVGLSLADRTLGAVFGVARGALILLVLVLAAGLTALPGQPFWRQAKLAAPLETAAIAVKPYLPREVAERVRFER